jgi:hypothetical protein
LTVHLITKTGQFLQRKFVFEGLRRILIMQCPFFRQGKKLACDTSQTANMQITGAVMSWVSGLDKEK